MGAKVTAPLPPDETDRLAALRALEIHDKPLDSLPDKFALLAAQLTGAIKYHPCLRRLPKGGPDATLVMLTTNGHGQPP